MGWLSSRRQPTSARLETHGLGFALLQDLKANEEIIMGWEWDDAIHKLPVLLKTPQKFLWVKFSSPFHLFETISFQYLVFNPADHVKPSICVIRCWTPFTPFYPPCRQRWPGGDDNSESVTMERQQHWPQGDNEPTTQEGETTRTTASSNTPLCTLRQDFQVVFTMRYRVITVLIWGSTSCTSYKEQSPV